MTGGYDAQRNFEKYLEVFQRNVTPEELAGLFRVLGSPQEAAEFHASLAALIEREKRWRWLFEGLHRGAKWLVGMGAAIIMLRDVIPWLLAKLGGGGS